MSVYTFRLSRHHLTLLIKAESFVHSNAFLYPCKHLLMSLLSLQVTASWWRNDTRPECLHKGWEEVHLVPSDRGASDGWQQPLLCPQVFVSAPGWVIIWPVFYHEWVEEQNQGNIWKNISKTPQKWSSDLRIWHWLHKENTPCYRCTHIPVFLSTKSPIRTHALKKNLAFFLQDKQHNAHLRVALHRQVVHGYGSACRSGWDGLPWSTSQEKPQR